MAENYRPIHGRVPIIIKTCMVTGKIKACDAWISSPNKFFFGFDPRIGFDITRLKPVTPQKPDEWKILQAIVP